MQAATPVTMVLLCAAGLLAVACLAIAVAGARNVRHIVYGASLALCAAIVVVAGAQLVDAAAPASTAVLPLGLPWIGAHFRVDALSAFFLVVINFGSAAASLYAIGYGAHETTPGRVLPFFPAFLAGMNLVLVADDAFAFLFAWELMSLTSWALVMAHHRDADNRRAGYVYLLMASFGTFALLLAFGLLAGAAGSYDFATIRTATHGSFVAAAALLLVLVGAGSKAGLVPLHTWLPLAHPAAPSHVSGVMSGVMTKVAIYGFIRVAFDLVGPLPWWTSLVVLVAGGISAALGVLYAVMQNDLKRLLAYSTIENIGIIFVGLGLAMAFRANGMVAAAALALTAALFHVLNHSFFKSLLFFGAGAVLNATGERDMDRLGGLIHRMPVTAFVFLVGAVAISALPPLNGFVSEWLTFQAILQSPELPQWGLKVMVPAVGGLLALSAALAAAAFVKAYGITFLGRARSDAATGAHEVDRFSLSAMSVLAFLCLAAGILPGFVIDALSPVAAHLLDARIPAQSALPWLAIVPVPAAGSSYDGLLVFLFIAITTSLAVYAIHRFASPAIRRAPPWDCGFPEPSPMTQYSSSSFAQPIRRVFGARVFGVTETVTMPPPGDVAPARFDLDIRDPVWALFYAPIARAVGFLAIWLNRLQFLTIRRYLGLVFLALIVLLMVLALWS
jgi:hydrogenase-4 component B